MLAACLINLAALMVAPQIAYMFIVNLFVPLSFGSLYFGRKQYLVAWVVAAAAIGDVLWAQQQRLGIALGTPVERLLFWVVLSLAFGRFLTWLASAARSSR